MLRRALAAMTALLAGCGSPPTPAGNRQAAAPAEAVADRPQTDSAIASLSPGQRRAYDRGLADCRVGRYRPENHPEAYRIGCAAAHER